MKAHAFNLLWLTRTSLSVKPSFLCLALAVKSATTRSNGWSLRSSDLYPFTRSLRGRHSAFVNVSKVSVLCFRALFRAFLMSLNKSVFFWLARLVSYTCTTILVYIPIGFHILSFSLCSIHQLNRSLYNGKSTKPTCIARLFQLLSSIVRCSRKQRKWFNRKSAWNCLAAGGFYESLDKNGGRYPEHW